MLCFLFHSLSLCVLVFLWENKRRKKFSTPKLSLRQSVVIFSAFFFSPLSRPLTFILWMGRMPCWNLNVRFFQLPSKTRAICLLTVIFLKKQPKVGCFWQSTNLSRILLFNRQHSSHQINSHCVICISWSRAMPKCSRATSCCCCVCVNAITSARAKSSKPKAHRCREANWNRFALVRSQVCEWKIHRHPFKLASTLLNRHTMMSSSGW